MTIFTRLNAKKEELENKCIFLNHSSVPKIILQNKINILDKLINAYNSTTSPISLTEAQSILDQQAVFDQQKRMILEKLEITKFWEKKNIKRNPLILCLVGPSGVGKTTFAQIIAQALGKKFFSVALNGLSDISVLIGSEANSPANNIGQLAQSLTETGTCDPIILLDEVDKTSHSVKNCLLNILDPKQNQSVLDYYLDVKLDFSQITFVLTANELKNFLPSLRDRMLVVELPGYNTEQKKEISDKIVQQWFKKNGLNRDNLEITSQAFETLVNKTREKGVRQLEMALNKIFDYCLLQWARESEQDKKESKITITPDLVNQIITEDYSNSEQEDKSDSKKDKEKLKTLWKELKIIQEEREKLKNELKTRKNNKLPKKMKELEQKNSDLVEKLLFLKKIWNLEIENLKKEIQDLQKKEKFNWNIKGNYWFILFMVFLAIGVIYSVFKLKIKRIKRNSTTMR